MGSPVLFSRDACNAYGIWLGVVVNVEIVDKALTDERFESIKVEVT
jgi:hypothetical protein